MRDDYSLSLEMMLNSIYGNLTYSNDIINNRLFGKPRKSVVSILYDKLHAILERKMMSKNHNQTRDKKIHLV